jgi:hypothetical protein
MDSLANLAPAGTNNHANTIMARCRRCPDRRIHGTSLCLRVDVY